MFPLRPCSIPAVPGAGGHRVALAFYIFKRDRRYLRFIWQVVKYTIFLLLGVLVFYAFERLVAVASVVN